MTKSEKEIKEGTEHLQKLAEEVERERAESGKTEFDVTVDPDDESPEGNNLSGEDAPANEDETPYTDEDADSPNATVYGRIFTQNSPS